MGSSEVAEASSARDLAPLTMGARAIVGGPWRANLGLDGGHGSSRAVRYRGGLALGGGRSQTPNDLACRARPSGHGDISLSSYHGTGPAGYLPSAAEPGPGGIG